MSHNTEGLLPHIEDINQNLFLSRASIICLQETWLRTTQTVNSLPGHTLISACRDSPRGGVALFINKNIQYTEVSTAGFQIECVAIKLFNPPVVLINVYRPPRLDLKHFCDNLQILYTSLDCDKLILLGDFNVDFLKSKILSLQESFSQVISKPTTRRSTLIDHIYIRNVPYQKSGVIPCYYSYHEMTYIILDENELNAL